MWAYYSNGVDRFQVFANFGKMKEIYAANATLIAKFGALVCSICDDGLLIVGYTGDSIARFNNLTTNDILRRNSVFKQGYIKIS